MTLSFHVTRTRPTSNDTSKYILIPSEWDDYFRYQTSFLLQFYDGEQYHEIGPVKIARVIPQELRESIIQKNKNGEFYFKTRDYLPNTPFTALPEEFCSLGQSTDYYDKIKEFFPDTYKEILITQLRDCALSSTIEEQFTEYEIFQISLLRDNEAERILREEKYRIDGEDIIKDNFTYNFTPPYSTTSIEIKFTFNPQSLFPNRLFAIIGRNGVGKTRLLSHFPKAIATKDNSCFDPHPPLFSKVLAVSNSFYDNYVIPERNDTFNYEHIGIITSNNGRQVVLTKQQLQERVLNASRVINQDPERYNALESVLNKVLFPDVVDKLFNAQNHHIKQRNVENIFKCLSSGEATLLYIFTNIIATLRFDTLLLFDEPETHLHPEAITLLMSALSELLERYQSYAIIMTHSPLVIREIKAESVRIMDRYNNELVIRKSRIETLGASASALYDEIFGDTDTSKYYKDKIKQLAEEGYTEAAIIQAITTEELMLPLGLHIYIKSITDEKNKIL